MPVHPNNKTSTRPILHIINALRVGGAEKLIVTLAGELQRRNVPLTVVTLRQNVPEVAAEVRQQGANLVEFSSRKLVNPARFARLWRYVQTTRPCVIHTHLTMANILGASVGTLTNTPVVTTLHNVYMHTQKHPIHGRAENYLLNHRAQRVLAVGWSIASAHQERLPHQPIQVLPNAVKIPTLPSAAKRTAVRQQWLSDPDQQILLVAVARLEPQKAFPDMLTMMADLVQTHPHVRLIVAGDGSERAKLEAQHQALQLGEHVRFLGVRDDVPDLLAAGDIFVSSSHWEGLPVSMLEALSTSLPIVGTAVGDVPEVITNQVGRLVPAGEPAQLANALRELLDKPDLRHTLSQQARHMAVEKYSAAVWVDQLLAIYNDLMPATQQFALPAKPTPNL